MGQRIETPGNTHIPEDLAKLSSIDVRIVEIQSKTFLELSTKSTAFRREFHHFALAVFERLLTKKIPAVESVRLELGVFKELLGEKQLLGQEKQTGLLGELLFLERIFDIKGENAIHAWGGPFDEPHDFRLDKLEFEVKSTRTNKRVHTIHGLGQLVPNEGCKLYLFSVMLGPAGGSKGFSLPEKANLLEAHFSETQSTKDRFLDALRRIGLKKEDYLHYNTRYSLRRPFAISPVDKSFPAITRPTIQDSLGPLANRIDSLQYQVDIEGLEKEEGTPEFSAVLPNPDLNNE